MSGFWTQIRKTLFGGEDEDDDVFKDIPKTTVVEEEDDDDEDDVNALVEYTCAYFKIDHIDNVGQVIIPNTILSSNGPKEIMQWCMPKNHPCRIILDKLLGVDKGIMKKLDKDFYVVYGETEFFICKDYVEKHLVHNKNNIV